MADEGLRHRASPKVKRAKEDARKAMEARLAKRLAKNKSGGGAVAAAAPAEQADPLKFLKQDPAKGMPSWLQYLGILAFVGARIAYSYHKLTTAAAAGLPLVKTTPDVFEANVASEVAACAEGLAGRGFEMGPGGYGAFTESAFACLEPLIDPLGDVRNLDTNYVVARVETAWTTAPTNWARPLSKTGALAPEAVKVWYAAVPEAAGSLEVAGAAAFADGAPPDVAAPCAADDGYGAGDEFGDAADGACYVLVDAGAPAEAPADKRVRVRPRENAVVALRGDAGRRADARSGGVAVVLEQYRLPQLLVGKATAFAELS